MKKSIFSIGMILTMLFTMFMCTTANAIESLITIGSVTPTPIGDIDVNGIIGVVKWLGYIVAIGMIIWCGVKYVMSGASGQAKAKETLIPILVGAVLVVAGVEITAAVFNAFGT